MSVIAKLQRFPIEGDFTIKFSLRNGAFEIKYPAETDLSKVSSSGKLCYTWKEVNIELDRIRDEYLHKQKLIRKVIIIQLVTSVSLYEKIHLSTSGVMIDDRNDYLSESEGFKLKWYIAEEYQYPKDIKYKIIETNKNNKRSYRIDILPQILFYDGIPRVFTYRKDLHDFLISLDASISDMLKKLVLYFDIDNDKFLKNFENNKFKLLGK